jgi:hypothetical protein
MDREIEVMRVLRTPPLGKLVAEFQGKRYAHLNEISENNVQRLLLAAIGELIDFAGGYETLVDAGVAPPMDLKMKKESAPLAEKQAAFVASLEEERENLQNKPVKRRRRKILPGLKAAKVDERPQMVPLIEQIDAILQKHVTTDPLLSSHSVHLRQNPAGGLQIEVNGEFYNRPSDIADKRIQIAIKSALKEWEST